MKRIALLAAIVLACSSTASAAPGDAELAAWYATWWDSQNRLALPNPSQVLYGWVSYDQIAYRQAWQITQDFDRYTAAHRGAKVIIGHWGLWPRTIVP